MATKTNAESIERVAVLGLGTMGVGITQVFALAGCSVRAFDPQEGARQCALERMRTELEQTRDAGITPPEAIEPALARITICESEADALQDAEFMTEAVIENLEIKQELFNRIEAFAPERCILASNTSTYPITEIAKSMRRPERAICTHWFNPGHIVPLVEVIPGEKTSDETTQTSLDLLERIGKTAVHVRKELPGFLVNRINVALLREVLDLLGQGVASAEDIDRAVQNSTGFRLATMGPLRIFDFAGHDVNGPVLDKLLKEISSTTEVPEVVRQLIRDGDLGVKTGKGIYDYSDTTPEKEREIRDQGFLKIKKLFHDSRSDEE
jgi:3-hydroxyacyl-CoA dehydrogenase